MIVSGPHSSGKTFFILEFIQKSREMFDIEPEMVFWCYGQRTALHETLVNKNFNMIQGMPANFDFVTKNSIVVLDDLMAESANDIQITNLFIRAAHHKPCFIIMVRQNLFPQGKQSRNQSLNANYMVLFKNPADRLQIDILSRRMFPNSKNFLTWAFEQATEHPYSYLFLDNHNKTAENARVRARILPSQRPMACYVDKRLYGGITTSKHLKRLH